MILLGSIVYPALLVMHRGGQMLCYRFIVSKLYIFETTSSRPVQPSRPAPKPWSETGQQR